MPCHVIHDQDGPTFICGRFPKDRPKKCAVCGATPSTLLCDGVLVSSRHGRTCDAPLCEGCTTRPTGRLVALPGHDDNSPANPMSVIHTDRRLAARDRASMTSKVPEQKSTPSPRLPTGVPEDTRDFCPWCVNRMRRGPIPAQHVFPW